MPTKQAAKPNILIVDDREEGLMALETVLQDCGYNLVRAQSGQEALSHLLSTNFAVVLMDVQMPEMNGFETASYIKKREKTRNIPIIFVTGVDRDERFVSHGYQSGAVDYLFKPFDPQILRSKVAVFVELYEQSQQIKQQAEQIAESQVQEQARQLERLELESRIRYRNLADAIPHIVWKAAPDFTVDYFNQTWSQYTGLSFEQSSGAGWKSAFYPEDLHGFMQAWTSAAESQKNFEVEARIYNSNLREHRWHLLKVVPERGLDDTILSWLVTSTEIHKLKEIEAQLIEAKKEADAANKAKSFFLANMSHEIRTPLGAIMGFSELLLQDDLDLREVEAHASTIKRNGEQLLKIIDEILDISKIESGSLHISKEKVYLADLAKSVESYVTIQASKKNLGLTFEIEGKVPEYIYSDTTRLRQILTNIIGNAVKFTHAGLIRVIIKYERNIHNGKTYFVIKDQGPGIDEKYINVLFKPFSQGDSSTSRKYGGTGLGLALSRKLARALDGDLVLSETKPGEGSTFTISVGSPLDSNARWIETLGPGLNRFVGKSMKQPLIRRGLEGIKVLVADDAIENQRLIRYFLEKAGATVEIANDGEEAIAKAINGDHNLVLMDIQMPGVDGYQATQALRSRGFTKPILAVTAHALIEERERCLNVGCTDHLSKPLDPRILVECVALHSNISDSFGGSVDGSGEQQIRTH